MFNIAICDDDVRVCEMIENYIRENFDNDEVDCHIYYTGEKLCQELQSGRIIDLIFLDIALGGISGVDVGNNLRNTLHNESTQIVYISSSKSYAMELFGVRPLNFLIKPVSENEVVCSIEKAMELIKYREEYFKFKVGSERFSLPFGDICYFSTAGRKIVIHSKNKKYEYYGRLDNVQKNVPPGFVRIHKSFLVNTQYAMRWAYEEITLLDGTVLSISARYRKGVRTQLMEMWK